MATTANRFRTTLELPVDLPYLLHRPRDHAAREGWPLVLFLHGSGERGDDLSLVAREGLPRRLADGLDLPAVVLAPQCPQGHVWAQHFDALMALLERVVEAERVDPERVVVTGLSLGGASACHLASTHPERFAALAPMCGPWSWYHVTPAMARLPLWAFHGDADAVVSVEDSRRLVARVRELGGEARLSEYAGVGHDVWRPAFGDPELLRWLVTQRRAARSRIDPQHASGA